MLGRRESSLARQGTEKGMMRFDPWSELEQMRTRMDELFSRVFGYTPLNRLIGPATFEPAVDICESTDSLLVNAYVPGLTKDDVDLNVTPDTITISGQWKHPHIEGEGVVCHVTGLGAGKFHVSYDLPVEIDPSKTKAVYKDGVLQITLPKTETSKEKTVKIRVEGS
jgi:HSP20 family protein